MFCICTYGSLFGSAMDGTFDPPFWFATNHKALRMEPELTAFAWIRPEANSEEVHDYDS